jgi:SAM-dependent methyltransferase
METFEHDFTLWMWFKKQSSVHDVLIEGYELYFVEKEIRDLLASLNVDEVVKIEFENYQFHYKGRKIPIVMGDGFKDVIKAIVEEDYREIKPKINYQTFEDLESMVHSRSLEKWEMSGVHKLIDRTSDRSFLDIGCNNGYMCFKAAEKFTNVVGIDANQSVLSVAQYLNDHIYRNEHIIFINTDFYAEGFDLKSDVIFCSSFLHYSIGEDKVKKFFDKCHSALNENGVLILEIELYPHMESAHLDVHDRPAGGDGSYPNLPWVLDTVSGQFMVTYLSKSIFQPGSNYPRYFFHFKKI